MLPRCMGYRELGDPEIVPESGLNWNSYRNRSDVLAHVDGR